MEPVSDNAVPRGRSARLSELNLTRERVVGIAYNVVTGLLLTYALVQLLHALASGFEMPLLDIHAFRQTQTAISAYFIAHGGPWLAYETPVFGAPYSIPFEFPLFQWLVVLVHKLGVPLDQAGRSVSSFFFLALLIPFYQLLRLNGASREVTRLTLAVFVTAPLYVFWSRAFLIESTALFFSLAALAAGLQIIERPRVEADGRFDKRLYWLCVSASLAMLVKVTTGFVYLMALGVIFVWRFVADRERTAHLRRYLELAVAAFVVPALPLIAWTRFADAHKRANLLTADFITSSALSKWNYGTWEQKTALASWNLLWDRSLNLFFGSQLGFAAFATLALIGARKYGNFVGFAVGLFSGYAVFINLHLVHEYYQYATGAMAILIVGLGMSAGERLAGQARAALVLPLLTYLIMSHSLFAYSQGYGPAQLNMDTEHVEIGKFVREHTPDDGLLMIYGDDWSPPTPYYSQRRAIMDRWNHGPDHPAIRETIARSAKLGHELKAVLFCEGDRQEGGRATKLLGHPVVCQHFRHCDVCL